MLLVFTFLFFFVGSSLADHAHDHDQDHIQVGDWVVVSDWEAKQWEQDQPAKSLRQPAARWEFLKFLFLPTIVQGWLLWRKCKLCSRTEHHGPLHLWLLAHSRPHLGRHQHAEGVRGHPFGSRGSTFVGRLWFSTGTLTSLEDVVKVWFWPQLFFACRLWKGLRRCWLPSAIFNDKTFQTFHRLCDSYPISMEQELILWW